MIPFLDYLELVPWVVTGVGGVAAAVTLPFVTYVPKPLRRGAVVVSLCVSALSAGVIMGKDVTGRKLDEAKREIERLETVLTIRDDLLRTLYDDAANRARENERLSNIVEDYEQELENGTANRCVADPSYDRRLRSILDGLPTP